MGNAMKALLETLTGVTVYNAQMQVLGVLVQAFGDGDTTVFVLDDGGDAGFEIESRRFSVEGGNRTASVVLRDIGTGSSPLQGAIDALADAEATLMNAARIAGWEYAVIHTRQARLQAMAAARRGVDNSAGVIEMLVAAAHDAYDYIEAVMALATDEPVAIGAAAILEESGGSMRKTA